MLRLALELAEWALTWIERLLHDAPPPRDAKVTPRRTKLDKARERRAKRGF